jgi:hypothetical protein
MLLLPALGLPVKTMNWSPIKVTELEAGVE